MGDTSASSTRRLRVSFNYQGFNTFAGVDLNPSQGWLASLSAKVEATFGLPLHSYRLDAMIAGEPHAMWNEETAAELVDFTLSGALPIMKVLVTTDSADAAAFARPAAFGAAIGPGQAQQQLGASAAGPSNGDTPAAGLLQLGRKSASGPSGLGQSGYHGGSSGPYGSFPQSSPTTGAAGSTLHGLGAGAPPGGSVPPWATGMASMGPYGAPGQYGPYGAQAAGARPLGAAGTGTGGAGDAGAAAGGTKSGRGRGRKSAEADAAAGSAPRRRKSGTAAAAGAGTGQAAGQGGQDGVGLTASPFEAFAAIQASYGAGSSNGAEAGYESLIASGRGRGRGRGRGGKGRGRGGRRSSAGVSAASSPAEDDEDYPEADGEDDTMDEAEGSGAAGAAGSSGALSGGRAGQSGLGVATGGVATDYSGPYEHLQNGPIFDYWTPESRKVLLEAFTAVKSSGVYAVWPAVHEMVGHRLPGRDSIASGRAKPKDLYRYPIDAMLQKAGGSFKQATLEDFQTLLANFEALGVGYFHGRGGNRSRSGGAAGGSAGASGDSSGALGSSSSGAAYGDYSGVIDMSGTAAGGLGAHQHHYSGDGEASSVTTVYGGDDDHEPLEDEEGDDKLPTYKDDWGRKWRPVTQRALMNTYYKYRASHPKRVWRCVVDEVGPHLPDATAVSASKVKAGSRYKPVVDALEATGRFVNPHPGSATGAAGDSDEAGAATAEKGTAGAKRRRGSSKRKRRSSAGDEADYDDEDIDVIEVPDDEQDGPEQAQNHGSKRGHRQDQHVRNGDTDYGRMDDGDEHDNGYGDRDDEDYELGDETAGDDALALGLVVKSRRGRGRGRGGKGRGTGRGRGRGRERGGRRGSSARPDSSGEDVVMGYEDEAGGQHEHGDHDEEGEGNGQDADHVEDDEEAQGQADGTGADGGDDDKAGAGAAEGPKKRRKTLGGFFTFVSDETMAKALSSARDARERADKGEKPERSLRLARPSGPSAAPGGGAGAGAGAAGGGAGLDGSAAAQAAGQPQASPVLALPPLLPLLPLPPLMGPLQTNTPIAGLSGAGIAGTVPAAGKGTAGSAGAPGSGGATDGPESPGEVVDNRPINANGKRIGRPPRAKVPAPDFALLPTGLTGAGAAITGAGAGGGGGSATGSSAAGVGAEPSGLAGGTLAPGLEQVTLVETAAADTRTWPAMLDVAVASVRAEVGLTSQAGGGGGLLSQAGVSTGVDAAVAPVDSVTDSAAGAASASAAGAAPPTEPAATAALHRQGLAAAVLAHRALHNCLIRVSSRKGKLAQAAAAWSHTAPLANTALQGLGLLDATSGAAGAAGTGQAGVGPAAPSPASLEDGDEPAGSAESLRFIAALGTAAGIAKSLDPQTVSQQEEKLLAHFLSLDRSRVSPLTLELLRYHAAQLALAGRAALAAMATTATSTGPLQPSAGQDSASSGADEQTGTGSAHAAPTAATAGEGPASAAGDHSGDADMANGCTGTGTGTGAGPVVAAAGSEAGGAGDQDGTGAGQEVTAAQEVSAGNTPSGRSTTSHLSNGSTGSNASSESGLAPGLGGSPRFAGSAGPGSSEPKWVGGQAAGAAAAHAGEVLVLDGADAAPSEAVTAAAVAAGSAWRTHATAIANVCAATMRREVSRKGRMPHTLAIYLQWLRPGVGLAAAKEEGHGGSSSIAAAGGAAGQGASTLGSAPPGHASAAQQAKHGASAKSAAAPSPAPAPSPSPPAPAAGGASTGGSAAGAGTAAPARPPPHVWTEPQLRAFYEAFAKHNRTGTDRVFRAMATDPAYLASSLPHLKDDGTGEVLVGPTSTLYYQCWARLHRQGLIADRVGSDDGPGAGADGAGVAAAGASAASTVSEAGISSAGTAAHAAGS